MVLNLAFTYLRSFPTIAIKMTMMVQRVAITIMTGVEKKISDTAATEVCLAGTKHAPLINVKLLAPRQEVTEICK